MCFERIRLAVWRPGGNDFARDSRGIGGERACFGFEEGCEHGVCRWRMRLLE